MRFAPLAVFLMFAFAAPAVAADRQIADFFGSYLGHGTEKHSADEEEWIRQERFSRVIIRPASAEKGFAIDRTTLELAGEKVPRQAETKSSTQTFRATDHPNVFRDVSSEDPTLGASASWAVITGSTLSVVQVSTAPDGNYFVTHYDRTLSKEGLDVRFTRFENSRIIRAMNLKLLKAPEQDN